MTDRIPVVADAVATNAAMHRRDLDIAAQQYMYFIQRRDNLIEKMRFGLVTLNGGSLIALISVLGGDGSAATWLGFTPGNAIISALSFTLGTILAGKSLDSQTNHYVQEAGDQNTRLSAYVALTALCESPLSESSYDNYGRALEATKDLPLTGFQYSWFAIHAQHLAAGAWFTGIGTPLISVLWPMAKAKLGI